MYLISLEWTEKTS